MLYAVQQSVRLVTEIIALSISVRPVRKRHMGIRPTVRGSVMNPNDHPHGGGEGKAPSRYVQVQ